MKWKKVRNRIMTGVISMLLVMIVSMCTLFPKTSIARTASLREQPAGRILTQYNEYVENYILQIIQQHVKVITYSEHGTRLCYGSGVVINHRKGYILTADHVVERGKCIEVITTSGKTYTVQNIKTLGSDIALLDVGMKMDAKSARLSPNEPYLGEDIYLTGIPSSHMFVGSISKGIISGKNRENNVFIPGVKLYQTDALLTGGNSGGGWYDRGGNLIAISNLKIGYTGNVGLGVPSTHILKLLQEQK